MSRFKKFLTSSNPVMSEDKMRTAALDGDMLGTNEVMTMNGSINKTFILLAILLFTAGIGWTFASMSLIVIGAIGGIAMVLWGSFKPTSASISAPLYAAFEGLFVGALSAFYAHAFDGIISQALLLTVTLLLLMLFIYRSGIIPVTNKLRTGIIMATGAVALLYISSMVLGMFGINIPYLHEGGVIGICISVVILGIACLNLLLDFDLFEKGPSYGLGKHYEWMAAMGLMVTLVWIYVEVLRLLSVLSSD